MIFTQRFGVPEARAAVLVHCSLGHSGGWAGMMAALTTPLDAVALDLPGHGRSPDWDGRGDYQAAGVAATRSVMAGPALVIGHSFGATIAMRLALDHPDLVAGLVLSSP